MVLFLSVWASLCSLSLPVECGSVLNLVCPAGPTLYQSGEFMGEGLSPLLGSMAEVCSRALGPLGPPTLRLRAGVVLMATAQFALFSSTPQRAEEARGLCFLGCVFLYFCVLTESAIFFSAVLVLVLRTSLLLRIPMTPGQGVYDPQVPGPDTHQRQQIDISLYPFLSTFFSL